MKKIAFCDLEGTLIDVGAWEHIKDKFGAEGLSEEYDKLYAEGKVKKLGKSFYYDLFIIGTFLI